MLLQMALFHSFFSPPQLGNIPVCFPCTSMVKNPLARQKTQVSSLHQEDSLGKEKATHSSVLAWEIPWIEESGGLQSMGSPKSCTWLDD